MLPIGLVTRLAAPRTQTEDSSGAGVSDPSEIMTPVRPQLPNNRFTVRDRITLTRWADSATEVGITRIRLEEPEPHDDPVVGTFALIYHDGCAWANWAVGRLPDGTYLVWRMANGTDLAVTGTLSAALELLLGA